MKGKNGLNIFSRIGWSKKKGVHVKGEGSSRIWGLVLSRKGDAGNRGTGMVPENFSGYGKTHG